MNRPLRCMIDPEQKYFWTPEWQAEEQKVEEEKRKGKVKSFRTAKELIEDLHELARESKESRK